MTAEDPVEWFTQRGFTLWFSVEDGSTWAHLRGLTNSTFEVLRYGVGTDEAEAGQRARLRWVTEQEGRPPAERTLP